MQEVLQALQERVRRAVSTGTPLCITGGRTKDFIGENILGEVYDVRAYRGMVEYEPTELVLTARAGTPLAEVEALLNSHEQMLAFEPPHFGLTATIGGCVAAGLSGPRRVSAGSVRDFVLGVRIIDGNGDDLRFGGKVIKNVAGYDVSRLMVGAFGTLGVITEVSFKVLPRPALETTLAFALSEAKAIQAMNRWAGEPLPMSASFFHADRLIVRLSGAISAVQAAREKLGGEVFLDADEFWRGVREQTHGAFSSHANVWRLSIASTTAPLQLGGQQIIEWAGGLRWIVTDAPEAQVREAAVRAGGSAMLFRARVKTAPVFHPLAEGIARITRKLKRAFDPHGIFNRGRMYADL